LGPRLFDVAAARLFAAEPFGKTEHGVNGQASGASTKNAADIHMIAPIRSASAASGSGSMNRVITRAVTMKIGMPIT
jgi:hypothetical protein